MSQDKVDGRNLASGLAAIYKGFIGFSKFCKVLDFFPNRFLVCFRLQKFNIPHRRGDGGFDFHVTPTVTKISTRVLPIDLVRYAVLFYASSLVRYAPSKIDPIINPGQAFLMDSVIHEVPPRLLLDALDNLTGTRSWIDPNGKRV